MGKACMHRSEPGAIRRARLPVERFLQGICMPKEQSGPAYRFFLSNHACPWYSCPCPGWGPSGQGLPAGTRSYERKSMNRKLKALGLALFAVLALGAFSASAAMAGDFHSETSTDTVIKGSQVGTDVFTVNAGTVKCNEATYAGNQSGATATTVKV